MLINYYELHSCIRMLSTDESSQGSITEPTELVNASPGGVL
jgi:hypothetical protein